MTQQPRIMASDVMKYGRMDGAFHLARMRVADLTRHLEEEHTADQAAALLEGLDLESLKPLTPLLRSAQRADRESMGKVIREYPHIALALVQERIHDAIASKADEIGRHEASMDRLRALLPRTR